MTYYVMLCIFVIIVVCEIYILMRNTSVYCLIFYFLIVQQISRGLSASYLDQGKYNVELGNYTINAYAGPFYFMYLSFLLLFINVFVHFSNKILNSENKKYVIKNNKDIREVLLNAAGIFLVLYLAVDMIISGIPLLSGGAITRFNYWDSYSKLPMSSVVCSFFTVFCVGYGVNLGSAKSTTGIRNLEIVIMIMMLVERLMLGYRVSGVSDLIIGFAVGYFYRRFAVSKPSRHVIRRVVQLLLYVILFSVTIYIVNIFINNPDISLHDVYEKIVERQLALSGHMEWAVFNDPSSRSWGINNNAELMSIFNGSNEMDMRYGIYGMMSNFAPTELFNLYYEDGVRYASSFIASSLYYNGIAVTLIMIIVNAFIYSLFYYLFRSLSISNHILTFAVLFRVYMIFNSYINASGTLTSFYRLNVFLLIVICFLLWYVENILQNAQIRKRRVCMISKI